MTEVKDRSAEMVRALEKALRAGAEAAAEKYRGEVRRVFNEYDNGPPSAPNTPPHGQSREALRRGRTPLADTVEVAVSLSDPLDVGVGSRADYALDLEQGTFTMPPRPLWGPVAERMREELGEAFARAALAEFEKLYR